MEGQALFVSPFSNFLKGNLFTLAFQVEGIIDEANAAFDKNNTNSSESSRMSLRGFKRKTFNSVESLVPDDLIRKITYFP